MLGAPLRRPPTGSIGYVWQDTPPAAAATPTEPGLFAEDGWKKRAPARPPLTRDTFVPAPSPAPAPAPTASGRQRVSDLFGSLDDTTQMLIYEASGDAASTTATPTPTTPTRIYADTESYVRERRARALYERAGSDSRLYAIDEDEDDDGGAMYAPVDDYAYDSPDDDDAELRRALALSLAPARAPAPARDPSAPIEAQRFAQRLNALEPLRAPALTLLEPVSGAPAATWRTTDWAADPASGLNTCFIDRARGLVLVAVRGDGSCLLHALLRAHDLGTEAPMRVRELMASDMLARRAALGPVSATVADLRRKRGYLQESEALCAYVERELATSVVSLVAREGATAQYDVSNVCASDFRVRAPRVVVVAHRGTRAEAHWEVVGRYDDATRRVSMLFARDDAYVRLVLNDFYARAGLPLI